MQDRKLYSFDVFDTCLIRTCGNPLAVFDTLAWRVLPDSSEAQRIDFALERRNGEIRARDLFVHGLDEEVTFDQIYDCCDFSQWTAIEKKEIQRIELQIERKVLLSVCSMKEAISEFRRNGYMIAFISDMYLPGAFIKEVLTSSGLYVEGDSLFVSSDIRLSKRTGALYKYVAKELSISYKNWTHYGDNYESDIRPPKSLGINTRHIRHDFNEYEERMANMCYGSSDLSVSVMASICKGLRLNSLSASEELFATTFVAPIFVPFVFGLLQEARKRGLRHLFFFARDAHIFYRIAQSFAEFFPEIEFKYLYVSRKSLYLPALKKVDYDSISEMFWNFRSIHVADIIERLQIDGYNYSRIGDDIDADTALRMLLEDEFFVKLVEAKRSEQKDLALKYFLQEGLGGPDCGIVDLTGTRKCHVALNRILVDAGHQPVFGLYFSVLESRISGDDYWSLHYSDRYFRNLKNVSFRPHELFEQFFCITDQMRTVAYTENGAIVSPVFEQESINVEIKKKQSRVNETVCLGFAEQYACLLKHSMGFLLSDVAFSVYSFFYYSPDINYLRPVASVEFSDSILLHSELFSRCNLISALRQRHHAWRNGLLVYNSLFPRFIHRLLVWDYDYHSGRSIDSLWIDSVLHRIKSVIKALHGKN